MFFAAALSATPRDPGSHTHHQAAGGDRGGGGFLTVWCALVCLLSTATATVHPCATTAASYAQLAVAAPSLIYIPRADATNARATTSNGPPTGRGYRLRPITTTSLTTKWHHRSKRLFWRLTFGANKCSHGSLSQARSRNTCGFGEWRGWPPAPVGVRPSLATQVPWAAFLHLGCPCPPVISIRCLTVNGTCRAPARFCSALHVFC